MNLGVNIDHIATLRNARGGVEPSVLDAALIAQKCDVSAITIHLREDRRHIKDSDLIQIKENITTPINLEMATTKEMQEIAIKNLPKYVCLVPEKRQEVTTEGGLDVLSKIDYMKEFLKPLVSNGIIVSMFIDPDIKQVQASYDIGAQFVELHTGEYSHAFKSEKEEYELNRLKEATKFAQEIGLKVNAGHGLNYENVHRMHEISGLCELNIGHSIVSRAVFVGLEEAIVEMKKLVA